MKTAYLSFIAIIMAFVMASTTPVVIYAADTGVAGNAAGKSQSGAQDASMAMFAVLMAMCMAMLAQVPPPPNPPPCIMAPPTASQGDSLGGTSAGAYNTAAMATTSAVDQGKTGVPKGSASLIEAQKKLADAGYKMSADNQSVILPDGTSVPTKSLGSDDTFKKLGSSDAIIAQTRKAIDDALANLNNNAKSGSFAGGEVSDQGGGGRGSGSGSASRYPTLAKGKVNSVRAAANVSGLSKNFGSDKIGIGADDIFAMIARRYKERESKDTFLAN